jgi:hypothetical protein
MSLLTTVQAALPPIVDKMLYSFARAFGATFLAGIFGVLSVPDFSTGKAALVALTVAALTSGVRAAQHILTRK